MGLLTWTDQELADKAIQPARAAWDEGRKTFVHQLGTGLPVKNDELNVVNLAVDGVVQLGWRLHTLTPRAKEPALGPVLLVFERPAPP